MSGVKQRKKAPTESLVNNSNIKRVGVALLLATIGLIIYTVAQGYTYQEKQKVQLQKTLQELRVKQSELDKNKIESTENQKKIEELQKQLQAKKDGQARALAESDSKAPRAVVSLPPGSHTDWMAQAGIAASDYGYVDYIISHESGWRPDAQNSIGCLGLAQACPGQKILNVCPDLNPVCQLRWASSYANRYGGWYGSYLEWQRKHWW